MRLHVCVDICILSLKLSSTFSIYQGADVNARDFCGWSPLHEACNHGHLEIASALLENGASVDDPGGPLCNGTTPLIDAANNGHVDVVQLLIEKGANVLIKDQRVRNNVIIQWNFTISPYGSGCN